MRRSLKLLVIFCGIVNSVQSFAETSYPYLDQVAYTFFRTYMIPGDKLDQGDKLEFHKKPEGWVISVVNYSDTEKKMITKRNEVFWNSATGKYQNVDFKRAEKKLDDLTDIYKVYSRFINSRIDDRLNYSIHCYYGYEGYEKDILRHVNYKKELNDTLKYSLAEALIHPIFFYTQNAEGLIKDDSVFINAKRGLSIKKELVDANVELESLVGDLYMKYSNDLVGLAYNADVFFNAPEQKKLFNEEAYPKWAIEYAKNMLDQCEENGILFTLGDNDTYPLIYVQEHFGFRKDVLVINQSLLHLKMLIQYLHRPEVKLNFSIQTNVYEKEENQMIVLEPTTNYHPLKDFLAGVQEGSLKKTTYGLRDESPLGQRGVFLEIDGKRIEWKINKARLFIGDLAILDIIGSNWGKRPIYFTPGQGSSGYYGLGNYIKREGALFHLTTDFEKEMFVVNADKMSENLLTKSIWDNAKSSPYRIKSNYYYSFYSLAEAQIIEERFSEAQRTLNKGIDLIGFDSGSLNTMVIYMLDLYARAGVKDKASVLLQKVILSGEMNLSELEKVKSAHYNFKFIDDIEQYAHGIRVLELMADKHEFIKEDRQFEKVANFKSRITELLNGVLKQKPYLSMLIASSNELMTLLKEQ